MISDVPRISASASSQTILVSASRPWIAAQVFSASTATPFGTATTSTTPGTFFAAVASKLFSLAPKRSGRRSTAVSMPGRRMSSA